jgi:nucleoside-diphosphate-sugar epimerase
VLASWNDLKVLVTGAKGFLGSHVVARLVQLGARTYGLARQSPVADDGIRWFCGDLSDPATVRALVGKVRPDVVFHLAGQTDAAPDRELVLSSFRNNLAATVTLLNELVEIGCRRVVVTGSLEEPEFGKAESVPTSPYGVSKWAEAIYSRMFHALYGLPAVIVRLYMTYGPRQRSTKLIPSVTLSLLRGLPPTISHPDREVDWVYVEDVVEGILAAGCAPAGVEGRTIELGSGVLVPIREIVTELQSLVSSEATAHLSSPGRSVGVHGRRANMERAHRLLGWKPTTPLRKGLAQTVAWYRQRLTDYSDSG